mmetsp:Transcript_2899/g.2975  ORF Transcript_2899/g.2975 Transcript_2899/m.2975 type:complete len:216 (-) Transcript_2899:52-699(-)
MNTSTNHSDEKVINCANKMNHPSGPKSNKRSLPYKQSKYFKQFKVNPIESTERTKEAQESFGEKNSTNSQSEVTKARTVSDFSSDVPMVVDNDALLQRHREKKKKRFNNCRLWTAILLSPLWFPSLFVLNILFSPLIYLRELRTKYQYLNWVYLVLAVVVFYAFIVLVYGVFSSVSKSVRRYCYQQKGIYILFFGFTCMQAWNYFFLDEEENSHE